MDGGLADIIILYSSVASKIQKNLFNWAGYRLAFSGKRMTFPGQSSEQEKLGRDFPSYARDPCGCFT